MGEPTIVIIDITRPYEQLATCLRCGLERHLPEDWQDILRREGAVPPDWDGVIRCRNGHQPEPMTIVGIVNHAKPEPDGTYIAHLVMDEDHRRAVCTGDLWGGIPLDNTLPVRLCRACERRAWEGAPAS